MNKQDSSKPGASHDQQAGSVQAGCGPGVQSRVRYFNSLIRANGSGTSNQATGGRPGGGVCSGTSAPRDAAAPTTGVNVQGRERPSNSNTASGTPARRDESRGGASGGGPGVQSLTESNSSGNSVTSTSASTNRRDGHRRVDGHNPSGGGARRDELSCVEQASEDRDVGSRVMSPSNALDVTSQPCRGNESTNRSNGSTEDFLDQMVRGMPTLRAADNTLVRLRQQIRSSGVQSPQPRAVAQSRSSPLLVDSDPIFFRTVDEHIPTTATVLLCGKTGIGKSTLINTYFGKQEWAKTKSDAGESVTKEITRYSLPEAKLTLIDSRGLELDRVEEAQIEKNLIHVLTHGEHVPDVCWYCIQEANVLDPHERKFFDLVTDFIPVVVVMTKGEQGRNSSSYNYWVLECQRRKLYGPVVTRCVSTSGTLRGGQELGRAMGRVLAAAPKRRAQISLIRLLTVKKSLAAESMYRTMLHWKQKIDERKWEDIKSVKAEIAIPFVTVCLRLGMQELFRTYDVPFRNVTDMTDKIVGRITREFESQETITRNILPMINVDRKQKATLEKSSGRFLGLLTIFELAMKPISARVSEACFRILCNNPTEIGITRPDQQELYCLCELHLFSPGLDQLRHFNSWSACSRVEPDPATIGDFERLIRSDVQSYCPYGYVNGFVTGRIGQSKERAVSFLCSERMRDNHISDSIHYYRPVRDEYSGVFGCYTSSGFDITNRILLDDKLEKLVEVISELQKGDLSGRVHFLWYCIDELNESLNQVENKWLKTIKQLGIPVVIIFGLTSTEPSQTRVHLSRIESADGCVHSVPGHGVHKISDAVTETLRQLRRHSHDDNMRYLSILDDSRQEICRQIIRSFCHLKSDGWILCCYYPSSLMIDFLVSYANIPSTEESQRFCRDSLRYLSTLWCVWDQDRIGSRLLRAISLLAEERRRAIVSDCPEGDTNYICAEYEKQLKPIGILILKSKLFSRLVMGQHNYKSIYVEIPTNPRRAQNTK